MRKYEAMVIFYPNLEEEKRNSPEFCSKLIDNWVWIIVNGIDSDFFYFVFNAYCCVKTYRYMI